MGWRVRVEGELLVLQVYEPAKTDGDYYSRYREAGKWRDATVTDIPVMDPFDRPQPERPPIYYTDGENITAG